MAEDNLVNQKVACHALKKQGVQVEVVGNGLLAVDAIRSRREDFDLVLMDIQMPVMDGLEATTEIKKLTASGAPTFIRPIPIIGLTAHAMAGYKEQCLAIGMDGYATKPINMKILSAIMLECLSTHDI